MTGELVRSAVASPGVTSNLATQGVAGGVAWCTADYTNCPEQLQEANV
jgi:hypothetical protein